MLLGGIDYLSVNDFAHRYGLTFAWVQRYKRVGLTRGNARIEFEIDAREASVNGCRVFMGEPIREYRHGLYLSRIDADHFIGPMIEPLPPRPPLRVIALDAGHGGKDTGKVNEHFKVFEKTFALDVVERLKPLLESAGYRVVLTRNSDRFVELEDRPAIAERAHADLFVSIHFNSAPDRVTGIEIFSLTPQGQFSTDDNRREAKDEAAVFNPGNRNDPYNSRLAYEMQREMLADLKIPDRGHKRQRWKVLRLALCPAILIEGGYLSNDDETRKIMTPAYRQEIAEAVAKGIERYAAVQGGVPTRAPATTANQPGTR